MNQSCAARSLNWYQYQYKLQGLTRYQYQYQYKLHDNPFKLVLVPGLEIYIDIWNFQTIIFNFLIIFSDNW